MGSRIFRPGLFFLLLCGLLLCFAAAQACSGDDDDDSQGDDGDDDGDEEAKTLSAASYNAGLAYGYVRHAAERLPKIQEALKELDVDILCLQEVWQDADIDAVTGSMSAKLPHAYRHDSKPDYENMEDLPAACVDLTDLQACATENCDGLPPDDLTVCVLVECQEELGALSAECMGCLAANIEEPFDEIVNICTNPAPPQLSYEGANGLLLLSKYELSDTASLTLNFYNTTRVVLYAKAETPIGTRHLFCTHLTAALAELPYAGDYESWEAEQAEQIKDLLAFIEEKAGGGPTLVMGDFNTGPAGETVTAEFPDNYQALISAGFVNPYVSQLPDTCTWCADNPLTGGDSNRIIDHVFVKGMSDADHEATRILDQEITLDLDGDSVASRLSDHYGVRVKFTLIQDQPMD